jgi:hypothetical protein
VFLIIVVKDRGKQDIMKQSPRLLLVIGIVLLAIGAFMSFAGGSPKADFAQAVRCRERFQDQAAEMPARCDEAAFATATTATDANQAAASISASNNQGIGGNALGMFLLGLGLLMTLASLIASRKHVRTRV